MFSSVAQRAFGLFQARGQTPGQDVADWLQAERELFYPAHLDVSESSDSFAVHAEVAGFTAKELEVNLDGRRLTISGKRETHNERKAKKILYAEHCSDWLLGIMDLPADVDAVGAKTSLKDSILELEVPKASPAKKIPVAPKNT